MAGAGDVELERLRRNDVGTLRSLDLEHRAGRIGHDTSRDDTLGRHAGARTATARHLGRHRRPPEPKGDQTLRLADTGRAGPRRGRSPGERFSYKSLVVHHPNGHGLLYGDRSTRRLSRIRSQVERRPRGGARASTWVRQRRADPGSTTPTRPGFDRRGRGPRTAQPSTTYSSRDAWLSWIGPTGPHTTMSSIRAPYSPTR